MKLFGDQNAGAISSPCRLYRYRLWRTWDVERSVVNFIMLNPSTADEVKNDPTIERCERRARQWKCGGLVVTNLFAFRSTDPGLLSVVDDPVGPENDEAIVMTAEGSELVIAAWGARGVIAKRGATVLRMLQEREVTLHHLGLTSGGFPRHPLYLPYKKETVLWG